MPGYFSIENTTENSDNIDDNIKNSNNNLQPFVPDEDTLENGKVIDNDDNGSYYNAILKSDIGSSIFHADVSGDTLSFYNLGIVYVDYIEMRRMFDRIREINIDITTGIAELCNSLNELASLVDYSLNITDLDMASIGLESNFAWNEEDNFSGMSDIDAASSEYILGLSDNVSNVLKIMNEQLVAYQKQTKMTDESITALNEMVNQVINNQMLTYTTTDGELKTISYNKLLNEYKKKERQYFQIDGINLYNVDGTVNKNAVESLNELLADEVVNRSGRFMNPEEGNTLGYLQCTWWANARASQFLGENYPTLLGNGGDYYQINIDNKWFEYGTEPKPNSLVVYNNGGYGHVGFVEAVDYVNGKIYISDADSGQLFRGIEELDYNGKWCGYLPQGYIYLDSPISEK